MELLRPEVIGLATQEGIDFGDTIRLHFGQQFRKRLALGSHQAGRQAAHHDLNTLLVRFGLKEIDQLRRTEFLLQRFHERRDQALGIPMTHELQDGIGDSGGRGGRSAPFLGQALL